MMTVLKIFIFVVKLMLRHFQTLSLSQAKTPDALPIQHSITTEDVMELP